MIAYRTKPKGDCLFAALFAYGTLQEHPLYQARFWGDPGHIVRGGPVEREMADAKKMRKTIVDYMEAKKNERVPKGLIADRRVGPDERLDYLT